MYSQDIDAACSPERMKLLWSTVLKRLNLMEVSTSLPKKEQLSGHRRLICQSEKGRALVGGVKAAEVAGEVN